MKLVLLFLPCFMFASNAKITIAFKDRAIRPPTISPIPPIPYSPRPIPATLVSVTFPLRTYSYFAEFVNTI
jgi:hypothetical protein